MISHCPFGLICKALLDLGVVFEYIGDQRMAVVTWGGRAFVCDDVDSAEHAFAQVFRDMEG
jgi:hypothetical protein